MNQTNRKKTRRMRQLFTILAVFTLLFCCMGCKKKTPRETLEKAYEKTFTKNNPAENLLGLKELTEKQQENKPSTTGLSLTLQELSGEGLEEYADMLSGLGITVNSASDLLNRKAAGTLDINYGGSTYITLGGQLQGSKVYLTVPQLLDGSLSVDFSTLKEDLESDSMLAQIFKENGVSLPEEISADLLQTFLAPNALSDLGKLTAALDDLDKDIVVTKADEKTVILPKDISAKTVYSVTVPKDSYKELLNVFLQYVKDYSASLLETLGEEAADMDLTEATAAIDQLAEAVGDIVINVAVTKDGYINYAATEITSEGETFSFVATFLGEENPLNETNITFSAEVDGETVELVYTESFDTKNNGVEFSADMSVDNTSLLQLSGKGEFTDVKKGEKYTFDMDYLEFDLADAFSVSLAGSYYIDTTKCEITTPAGTEYGLFTMTELDFSALVMQVLSNIQKDPLLSGLLDYIDLGL